MSARLRITAGTGRPLIPYLSRMVNNFLYFPVGCRGRLRITPSPQAILFRLSTHVTSGFVHLSAETLQGENFSPRAFLRETSLRNLREARAIFACLLGFDPLGSPLTEFPDGILTELR